jgi:repressor LexA
MAIGLGPSAEAFEATILEYHSFEWYLKFVDDQPTVAQARVLAVIQNRVEQGEPAPTYRDLCEEFGWSSTGTVRDHLRALARKGYVQLSGPRHRQIRLRGEPLAVSHVPIVGRVVAGLPVLAEENVEGRLPVPVEWTTRGTYFALRVNGDSMKNAGILEGDYVVVRQQATAEDREVVVVVLEGSTTLKRLQHIGKRLLLAADNPRYRPIQVQTETAVIQGVVVGLLRAYRGRGSTRWVPRFVSHGAVPRDAKSRRGRRR